MTWLIVPGILVLLCLLPVGVRAIYSREGFRLWMLIGPAPVLVFPENKPEKTGDNVPKKADKPKKKTAEKPNTEEESKELGNLRDFLPLLDVAKRLLCSFFRKIRIRRLELKVVLAGGDPCDLAVNYGRTWAATGSVIPALEEIFVIKKRDVQIGCDFAAEETKIYAAADVTILTGRLLGLAAVYGYQALREYFKLRNKRKGEQK